MSSFFPALHLDSPILDVNLKRAEILRDRAIYDNHVGWRTRDWNSYIPSGIQEHEVKQYQQVANVFHLATTILGVDPVSIHPLTPSMYPFFFTVPTAPRQKTDQVLAYAEAAVRPIISAHIRSLAELTSVPLECMPASFFNEETKRYYAIEEFYASLIEEFVSRRNQGAQQVVSIINDFTRGIISEVFCIIYVEAANSPWFSLSYEQLLMLRDCAMMRKNGHLASKLIYPNDTTLRQAIDASFGWQELCLERFGNEGYEIAKSVESLAKAYLSRVSGDILVGPDDSFSNMLEKIAGKERDRRGLDSSCFPLQATLSHHFFLTVLQPLTTVSQVCEIFGLQKFSGHPLIDPRAASAKSRLIAQAHDPTSPAMALQMRSIFCDMFTKSYIVRHRMWPPLSFRSQGTELQRLYESRVLSLGRQYYELSDWNAADFEQCLDFDEYENYFELIDDKSISLLLSEKHATWDGINTSTYKRLLLELLRRFDVDTHGIIRAIEDDVIPVEWLICSLYPKEREFKLAARAFTMMVFEMRTFFTIHEANLAESVLKYFPSITMVDTKIDVHRRFLTMTRPLDSPDLVRLLLELDLSSWNLMWRGLIVEGIGQQINCMFGVSRVFTTVHKFFERCCMMMRVAGCRPDEVERLWPPESDLIHYNHAGGLEGIAQKLWSLCTVAMIQLALHRKDVSYTITDQGDNIVLVITAARDWTLPLYQQLTQLSKSILEACSSTATAVHQELKPEECLISTTVLTYSKLVYVDGVDYPTSIKALSRIYPASAVDFPSVSAYIAAIFSGCYTAAEGIKAPEICYRIALLQGSIFLTRLNQHGGPYTQAARNRPHLYSLEGIRYQLLWPSELGGYPVIGPYSFLYKGGSDPLSKSIASLKMLQKYNPEVRTIIGAFQSDTLYDPTPKIKSLIQDPYGLPIRKPPTPGDAIAKDTLDVMRELTNNREIKEVLDFATDDYEDKLIDALCTMTPFNPLIAHKLMEASAVGTVNSLKRMGLKTQTIQSIARADPDSELIGRMISAGIMEVDNLWALIVRFRNEKGMIVDVYSAVELARRRWSPSGKIPLGLTSYLPIDFDIVWNPSPVPQGVQVEYCTRGQDAFYTRGPSKPYLGSTTITKYSDHGYRIVGRGYASSALRALQVVLAWCEPTPATFAIMDYLSSMRSGIKLSEHSAHLVGVYGGSASHRFDAYLGSRNACLLGQSAFAHFVTLYTDRAGYLSGSTQDYAIMWQEFMCYGIALCSYRWSSTRQNEHGRLVICIGSSPLDPLPDDRLSFSDYTLPPTFPSINRLVQSDSVLVKQTGGPIWSSSIPLHTDPSESYEFAALVAVLTKGLGGRIGIGGVVESVTSSVSIAIGLTELRGMGLRTFMNAAACALLDAVPGIVYSPTLSARFNVNVNFLIQKFGSLVLSTILPYLSHPDMAEDPIVIRLNIGPGPRYDTRYSAHRLLLAELSSTVLRLYYKSDSMYYTQRIVVFGSDSLDGTESAIFRLLRRRVSQAVIRGLISYDEGQFLIGSPIRRLVSSRVLDKKLRINSLREILLSYSTYRRGSEPLSQAAVTIPLAIANSVAGYSVYATRAAASEIVRRYRYRSHRPSSHSTSITAPSLITANVILTPLDGSSPQHRMTDGELLLERFDHAYGQARSFGSGAMNVWLPLAKLFNTHDVLVVGSGLGACAASALIGGARWVRGHDLRIDYPPSVPLGEYSPPLVRLYGQRKGFAQTEETLATSGDWFDPKVARLLCTLQNSSYILVLDISSEKGFSHEVLRPLILNDFPYRVLLRIVNIPREHELVCGVIARVGMIDCVWEKLRSGVRREKVYSFTVKTARWPLLIRPHSAVNVVLLPASKGRLTADQLTAYILSPLGGLTGVTLRDSLRAGVEIFQEMITNKSSRPTYEEWTQALHSMMGIEILLTLNKVEFKTLLSDLKVGDVYYLVSAPTIAVLVTPQLLLFLSQTVPRIATHLGRTISHHVTIRP